MNAQSKKYFVKTNMDLVHNLKGKIVVYCLECEPDAEGRPFRYVGCTTNCERRMAEHMGMKEGGAAWCKSCLLYTSPSPRDKRLSRMPSSA